MSGKSLLNVDSLSAGYGALSVLRDISLSVNEGEVVGILGPNGHGKTTLVRTICGLLEPVSGSVRFDGADLKRMSPELRRRRGMCLVPQGDLLFGAMTVDDNLAAGAYTSWRDKRARRDYVYALFPELLERRSSLAATLSGGQRRMLAIGRAIMSPSRILLVDEPSIGLSPSAILRVYQALAKLRDEGCAILLVEETLTRLESLTERVYLIDHGRIKIEASPEVLANSEHMNDLYLGGI